MRNSINLNVAGATCGNCSAKIEKLILKEEKKNSEKKSSCFQNCLPAFFTSTPPQDMSEYITSVQVRYSSPASLVSIEYKDLNKDIENIEEKLKLHVKYKLKGSKFSLAESKPEQHDRYTAIL